MKKKKMENVIDVGKMEESSWVAVVKLLVSLIAIYRSSRPTATAIVRLATAIDRSSCPTAIFRLAIAIEPPSSSNATEQAAMWRMIKRMKMRKTRRKMMRIKAEGEGGAAGRVVAVAAARSARNRQHPWLRRSERSSPPVPAKHSPGGRCCSMSNLRRR
jgi:hypothetical protein